MPSDRKFLFFRRRRRQPPLVGREYRPAPAYQRAAPVEGPAYQPHGIDSPETLAKLRAQAEAAAAAPPAVPPPPPPPPRPVGPPPPMPYPSATSRAMVHQIDYPDPSDLSPDKDRRYRDMLRRVGVATGTRTPLEDTGMWPRLALEPGDGTGTQL